MRTVSLEPGEGAERLAALTEGLDIERRSADTAEAAKAAVRAPGPDGVIVIDTPPVSAGDPDGIAALGRLLAAMRPDETHLVTPAGYDARSLLHLNAALDATCPVNRILISRIDEAPSAAVAVGVSLQLKRPVSYLCDGRRPADGLRPAEARRAGVAGDALMADQTTPPLVALSDHPRAAQSIRQIKAWGGLLGFGGVVAYST